ncbi:DALR anticodon-binding domain-containing protein, partial [Klebsiella pneumoniae]|uniref:DALR anticodon-binding domain-containing protein n=1 Tax=Klebsiella pneumoniae TaxID=573 RepID=UPI002118329F
ETEILAKLAAYPEILVRAANSYEPHQIGNYLKELAALFHGWYNDNKVLGDDAELTQARLLLSVNVRQVLRNGLELVLEDTDKLKFCVICDLEDDFCILIT